jgi:hypothetical protein
MLLAGYHGSDGTGKLAVAYEAARCHARAAFCIAGRGVRTSLSAGADRGGTREHPWTRPAPAAFLESRRGRRSTAGTLISSSDGTIHLWGSWPSAIGESIPKAKPPTGQHFAQCPEGGLKRPQNAPPH